MEIECGRDGEEAESRGGFLAGGCIAILKECIAKGWSQPSDEIAEKTERCLFLLMPERKQKIKKAARCIGICGEPSSCVAGNAFAGRRMQTTDFF